MTTVGRVGLLLLLLLIIIGTLSSSSTITVTSSSVLLLLLLCFTITSLSSFFAFTSSSSLTTPDMTLECNSSRHSYLIKCDTDTRSDSTHAIFQMLGLWTLSKEECNISVWYEACSIVHCSTIFTDHDEDDDERAITVCCNKSTLQDYLHSWAHCKGLRTHHCLSCKRFASKNLPRLKLDSLHASAAYTPLSSVCSTECSPPIGQEAGILDSDWSIKCLASNRSRPVHCRARLLLSNSRRPAVLCICTLVFNFVFFIARLLLCKNSRKTNWLLL